MTSARSVVQLPSSCRMTHRKSTNARSNISALIHLKPLVATASGAGGADRTPLYTERSRRDASNAAGSWDDSSTEKSTASSCKSAASEFEKYRPAATCRNRKASSTGKCRQFPEYHLPAYGWFPPDHFAKALTEIQTKIRNIYAGRANRGRSGELKGFQRSQLPQIRRAQGFRRSQSFQSHRVRGFRQRQSFHSRRKKSVQRFRQEWSLSKLRQQILRN